MTFDPLSLQKLKTVYPDFAIRVTRTAEDMSRIQGLQLKVTQAVRTMESQQAIWAVGRELQGGVWMVVDKGKILTNCPPGYSMHQFGIALDCAFAGADPYLANLPEEKRDFLWAEFGRIAQAHGLSWGGAWQGWKDRPHVELLYGFRPVEIREFYKVGGMQGVWRALDKHRGVPEGQGWLGQPPLDTGPLTP